jgi:sulfate permease, SulP family
VISQRHPLIGMGGSKKLYDLHDELAARNIACCVVGAHGQLRDLLQSDGLAEKTAKADWIRTLDRKAG